MKWIVLLVTTLALPAAAHADDADSARAHYQQGTTLYDLGQYGDAAREYEAAYKAKSDPALLFNIGQAYRLGGHAAGALRAYRSFLRRQPDARNRREVESFIAKLQKQIDDESRAPVVVQPTTPEPAPAATTTLTAPPPAKTPLYKKWWLWTAVGGVVVLGVAVGVAVAYTTPNNASAPAGALSLSF